MPPNHRRLDPIYASDVDPAVHFVYAVKEAWNYCWISRVGVRIAHHELDGRTLVEMKDA